VRIIAGSAKGRRLRSLRGRALRPTSERLREAVLATLGPRVEGARFLDLYAGAGAVGLESLSRGAAEAIFVESHRPAGRLIQDNARLCGFEDRVRILVMTVERGLARLRREGVRFDVVFIDPPYDRGEATAAMAQLGQWPGLVAPGGVVVCQHSRHEELGEEIGGLSRMRRKRFGETIVDSYESREEARHSAGGSRRTIS
jgi:16S rRNA (guanine(966)-N(2))-methyltransferase RsmD